MAEIFQKILIVDDDISCLELGKLFLTSKGFEVHTASNGKIGIFKALKISPQLILMDLNMPIMGGLKAVSILRKTNYQGIIVAWTESIIHSDSEIIKAGYNYIIYNKSIFQKEIFETIESLMKSTPIKP